jgi:hypothetical protein
LTGDDVSSGQRAEARNRLRREWVDVDALETDFIAYQAIRSYLKEYRGANYERPEDEHRVENAVGTLQRLTS